MEERASISPSPGLFVAATMLFIALAKMPYGYYEVMRWVVAVASGYAAWSCQRDHRVGWFWTLLVVAICFNPVAHLMLDRQRWMPLDLLGGIVVTASAFSLLTPEISTPQNVKPDESKQPDWVGGIYFYNIILIAVVAFSSFDHCSRWALLALIPVMPALFIWGLAIPGSFFRPKHGQTGRDSLYDAINDTKRLWNCAARALTLCAILVSLNVLSMSFRYTYDTDANGATIRYDHLLGSTVTANCAEDAADEGDGQ